MSDAIALGLLVGPKARRLRYLIIALRTAGKPGQLAWLPLDTAVRTVAPPATHQRRVPGVRGHGAAQQTKRVSSSMRWRLVGPGVKDPGFR